MSNNYPYQVMPDLTEDEFEALKADIKERGVRWLDGFVGALTTCPGIE